MTQPVNSGAWLNVLFFVDKVEIKEAFINRFLKTSEYTFIKS